MLDQNALNKEIKATPVEVTAITSATNGVTNIVDVDRSAYYDFNGEIPSKSQLRVVIICTYLTRKRLLF
jgi:hypothetical protein